MPSKKITVRTLRAMKRGRQKIVALTAYDTPTARILDEAGPETLVLLDELGTGTDPEEGAALAMAVGVSPEQALAFSIHNCSITELAHLPDHGSWAIARINERPA